MRRLLLTLFMSVLIASAPALEIIPLPADTTWLLNLDVKQALQGPLGDLIRERAAKPKASQNLRTLLILTGIDPLRDIDQVVASGTDFTPASAMIVLTGRFDGPRLTTLVEAAKEHKAIAYADTTIHRWIDSNRNAEMFAALSGNHLLFTSSLIAAKHGLDALASKAAVPTTGPVATASHLDGPLILAIAADHLDTLPRLGGNAAMLRQVRELVASLRSDKDNVIATVNVGMTDEAAAIQLMQIGQGLLALAALNQNTPPETKALLANVKITHSGSELTVQAPVSIEAIRAAMAKQTSE